MLNVLIIGKKGLDKDPSVKKALDLLLTFLVLCHGWLLFHRCRFANDCAAVVTDFAFQKKGRSLSVTQQVTMAMPRDTAQ